MYFFSVLACTVSSLFNELVVSSLSLFLSFPSGLRLLRKSQKSTSIIPFQEPVFWTGLQRYALFFNFQIFIQNFSIYFSCASLSKELSILHFRPFFERGCKGRHYFLISKSFFKNFSIYFFMPQSFKELYAFSDTRFSNGIAKVRLFPLLPNLWSTIFKRSGRFKEVFEGYSPVVQCIILYVTFLLRDL